MAYIPTEKVESSNIEEIGYHRQTQTLRVIFQEGRAYDYPLVPEREYKKLMAAESKGRFFNLRIKTLYGHRTVRPEQLKEPCCDHPADATCSDECYPCDSWCCAGGPSDTVRDAITAGLRRGHQIVNPKTTSEVPPALPRTPEGEVDYEAIPDAGAVIKKAEAEATCAHPNQEATSDGSVVGCADCDADLHPKDDGAESTEAEARSHALNAEDDEAELGGTPIEEGDEEREAVIDTVCRCCGKSIRIPPEDAVELCGLCFFEGKGGDTNEQCTEHHDRRDDCPHGADGRDCESSCGCACHTGASD